MCGLSADIRDSDDGWARRRHDSAFAAHWHAEGALRHLSPAQVNYVLSELDAYTETRDGGTGIEVCCTATAHVRTLTLAQASCFDRIWQSDELVPSITTRVVCDWIRDELSSDSYCFRNPKWPQTTYDIIHPSLFCWVAGRTRSPFNLPALSQQGETRPDATSRTFAWIATDYTVSETTQHYPRVTSSGYINNLHPDQRAMRAAIDDIVGAFIPLFERVLSDLSAHRSSPKRVSNSLAGGAGGGLHECFGTSPFATSGPFEAGRGVRLAGRDIQVFVKLSVIHLVRHPSLRRWGLSRSCHHADTRTSRLPWRRLALLRDAQRARRCERRVLRGRIVRFLSCPRMTVAQSQTDSNVDEQELDFRAKVDLPRDLNAEQVQAAHVVWGIESCVCSCSRASPRPLMGARSDGPMNQRLPSTILPAGRCIAFPNLYQHRVGRFSLQDPTRSGHRVILSILLADPNARVISTASVPPQQAEWAAATPERRDCEAPTAGACCPRRNRMSAREAQLFREQLEDERDNFAGVTQQAWAAERWTIAEHDMDMDMDD